MVRCAPAESPSSCIGTSASEVGSNFVAASKSAGSTDSIPVASAVRSSGATTDSRNIRAGVLRAVSVQAQTHQPRPGRNSHLAHARHDLVLDASAEDAAAQKKRIQVPGVVSAFDDDEPDEAVVAEAVADADGSNLVPASGDERLQLRFIPPPRREVELVGPQCQLRGTTQVLVR